MQPTTFTKLGQLNCPTERNPNITYLERIMKSIIIDPETQCWTTSYSKKYMGKSSVFFKGEKGHRVHKLLYEHHKGDIPEGYQLNHKCKNECCNPDHMYIGTSSQNALDSVRDGTHPMGKSKKVIIIKAGKTITFKSIREFAKFLGIDKNSVRHRLAHYPDQGWPKYEISSIIVN